MPKPIAIGLRNSAGLGNSFRERGIDMKIRISRSKWISTYFRLSDLVTLPLLLVAAYGAIESSFQYGFLGAFLKGQAIWLCQ